MRDESAAVTPAAVRKMKAHFDSRLTMGQRVERWLNGGHENAAAVGMVRSYSASADLSFSIEKEEVAPVSPQAGSTATARTRTLYWALGSTDSEHTALRLAQRRLALAFLLCATIDAPEWLLAVNTSGAFAPVVEKVAAYMSTRSGGSTLAARPRPFDRPAQSGQAGAPPPADALKEFGQGVGAGSSGARQGEEAGRTAAGPPQGVQAVTTRTRARSG